ncbi:hypothetical protein AnigIFM62618_008613 [Aspergillus niger]|nr:hypothetical protein AnigIFM62618_008613 [Aspergillus niger]
MVKLLLEFKADVDQSDLDTCMILLSTATVLGHTEIVRCLLESEADVNLENLYGEASFYIATRLGYLEITQLLLARGADVDKLVLGESSLYFACKDDHVNVVRVLLANTPKPNLNLGSGREQPLLIVIYHGYTEIVALLLKAGVDVNCMCGETYTPLEWAVKYNCEAAVLMILEYQVKIDWKSSWWSGVLRLINQRTEVATVKHLICCGVDPEDANKKGECAIWVAVRINNEPVVQYLVLNMVRILAEAGVDVNFVVLGGGETLLQAACNCEVDGSKLNDTLEIIRGDVDLVDEVLESHKQYSDYQDTYMELVDKDGWTPLYWAVRCVSFLDDNRKDMVPMIEYLVE